MLDILSKELTAKEIKHLMLTGSTKTNERLALTEQFNSDDTPVFLISLKAGGTGLNLTGADIVIHYDPWWNMSAQNQATDRAHRLGQEKTVQVFLKAGGTGLNLTGADIVIHYDPWWNMSAQNQATDRAHRLGQEKTVQVFKLFVKNTIEEKIERLQQRKRDLTEAIVQEGETFITQLSSEELTALFETDFVKNTIEEKIERLQQRKRDLTEAIVQEGETFITQLSSEELTALFETDDDF